MKKQVLLFVAILSALATGLNAQVIKGKIVNWT